MKEKPTRLTAKADFALIRSSDKSDGKKSKETPRLLCPTLNTEYLVRSVARHPEKIRRTKRQEWGLRMNLDPGNKRICLGFSLRVLRLPLTSPFKNIINYYAPKKNKLSGYKCTSNIILSGFYNSLTVSVSEFILSQ